MYIAASATANWLPGMLPLVAPPSVMLRALPNSTVSSKAAWATPNIMPDIQTLALVGTFRTGGPSGSHGAWGAGRLDTGAMFSGTNTLSKSTSWVMEPRAAMANQVSSMVSPGWLVGISIQRLSPSTIVLRNIQVEMLDPLTKGHRPDATKPPGADLVSPPGMAACEIKEPFSATSRISE